MRAYRPGRLSGNASEEDELRKERESNVRYYRERLEAGLPLFSLMRIEPLRTGKADGRSA
mgnify:CR=1 FL=1